MSELWGEPDHFDSSNERIKDIFAYIIVGILIGGIIYSLWKVSFIRDTIVFTLLSILFLGCIVGLICLIIWAICRVLTKN